MQLEAQSSVKEVCGLGVKFFLVFDKIVLLIFTCQFLVFSFVT